LKQFIADVDKIARAHLASIDNKIIRLKPLRREIARMLEQCAQGRIAECRVIEALADHSLCASEHGA